MGCRGFNSGCCERKSNDDRGVNSLRSGLTFVQFAPQFAPQAQAPIPQSIVVAPPQEKKPVLLAAEADYDNGDCGPKSYSYNAPKGLTAMKATNPTSQRITLPGTEIEITSNDEVVEVNLAATQLLINRAQPVVDFTDSHKVTVDVSDPIINTKCNGTKTSAAVTKSGFLGSRRPQ